MLEKIEAKVTEVSKRIRKFRQEIHRNPELSGLEEKTSAFVAGVLEANDIEVRRNVGGYGVVGLLKGAKKGKTIAFRADMDALPIQETGTAEYASCVPGVMHACGHDVHTAILMGAAVVLASLRNELKGNVKFIFQPSEERGSAGAKTMIRDGALKNPKPAMIAALHCFPEREVGEIAHRAGPMTALADRIKIVIKGKGGHASRPHQTVDAVLVASMVINAIHHIVSRRTNPLHQTVISICTIKGGEAANIIADNVEMEGTVRTLDEGSSDEMPTLIEETVRGVTMSVGADYEFEYEYGTPSVVNDASVDTLIKESAIELLGEANVHYMPSPLMGAEDFAYFTKKIPGALFRLGTANKEKGLDSPLHNPNFDIDEDALDVGVKLFSLMAVRFLMGK
jgi:amidohydrolase